ncbi:MAG: transposase [Alphaproteobacteria bacterium]|nr:transposase [Alphaproteobacteria bacterium]
MSPGRVCAPGQNESGGKRKPARLRKGAPWLKTTLVQCAVSASKTRKRTAISGRSSGASRPAAAPRKPPARWPHRCSPRSTTCSRMAPRIATSGPPTLTNGRPR